jgi:hypothetical protein
MRRNPSVLLVVALLVSLIACKTWPVIIATAQAISAITSIVFPQVEALSADAVLLLQEAEAAAQAWNANKNATTEQRFAAAIQAIETKLPADLAALNIPVADRTKVEAAVNIILDYVESLGVQSPATASIVRNARAARNAPAVTKPMTKADITQRWNNDVCHQDARCMHLLKQVTLPN